MRSNKHYDSIIIGSGQSGTPLVFDLTKRGQKVAFIEKNYLGGSCLNYGCTPTKTLIASSNLYHRVKNSHELGIEVSNIELNFQKVMERKNRIVRNSRGNIEENVEKDDNVELYRGLARFVDKNTVNIKLNDGGVETITANEIFINTGSTSNIIPIDGIEDINYYDSTSIMEVDEVPKHLAIVGTSYIALEFGQMFNRFGSKVTMIGDSDGILSHEDKDISSRIQEILEDEGINFSLNTDTKQVAQDGENVSISVERNGSKDKITCSHFMLATGRTPNTKDLNLANAGVDTDDDGNIKVNPTLKTSTDNIYALGDVKGGPQFTHISHDDFRVLIDNMFGEGKRNINDRLVPFTLFTDPQLGRVGLTEKQAREEGYDITVGKVEMAAQSRPKEEGRTKGFLKAVVNKEDDKILGVAMLGYQGGELMAMVEIAMMADMTYDKLRDGIFSHPNLSEILNKLFDI